jgi:pilus assembly protein CpaB
MRNLGIGLLVAALLLGALAVWGVKALSAPRKPAGVEATALVVAAKPIEVGETITADRLKLQAWPAGAVPEGAFASVALLTDGKPRVALRPIAANEPILAARVSGPGGRATLSAMITPGKRAVTIRVNDVFGVAGFVLPGDFVDVLITRAEGDRYGSANTMRTDTLLEAVRVLAVDQTASENKNEPVVAKAATIEVGPEQAQKLALAAQVGTLSLALRGTAAQGAEARADGTVRVGDLRLGGTPERGPAPQAVAAPAPRPEPAVRRQQHAPVLARSAPQAAGAVIEVVRRGQASEVRVSRE